MTHKILYIVFFLPCFLFAQEQIEGMVVEANNKGVEIGLSGANVFWLNTSVGTVTDLDGQFTIPYQEEYKELVISYVGYKTDTISVTNSKEIRHLLLPKGNLDEVVVTTRKKASSRSFLASENVINISSAELLKAACCNLSESFETNPSIDVNFADAISGTRQIKMLGLTSPYILITTENIPSIRGASQAYGLSFIPGTWVESIQITKGAGSVVNGFESIAGQINAELQKPTTDSKLFVNLYGAANGRFELNTHVNTNVSEKWSTGLYVHGNIRDTKFDKNDDSFLDMPLAKQVNVMNRWQYTDPEKGFVSFINFRFLNDEKQTGQIDFNPDTDKLTTNAWGGEINTQRFDVSAKLGYVNPNIPYENIGAQVAFSNHNQESYFGLREYNIEHNSLYANGIYSSIIGDSRHKFKTGLSATYDSYKELVETTNYDRVENSVGAFFEYKYDNLSNLNVSAGLRVDNHNLLGAFVTPRLHARYTAWEKGVFRGSVGRGKRSANIFTENQSLFSTGRAIRIVNEGGSVYGLDPEVAWNYGVSYLQGFDLFGKKADITFDFYRTDFQNQVVVDWENSQEVSFYNLKGSSYANSFQAEFNIVLAKGLDFRSAYKYYEIKTAYNSGMLKKPLTPSHRIFGNISYETYRKTNNAHWKFDATYNWLGEQRFSSTAESPSEYKLPAYSPSVATLNAQVTKVFSNKFEVYLGGENITNVKQDNPIVSSENPFGANFDTTFVYGPIFGSSYYAGLRFKLN
ncbi:TonB-dependent receptor [Ulvibacter litoralis]|uniref:Outer membrane receptor for ferrienterochelin and colicins n=1 Tax=Ulvibacter litoralis TaxID=227084 RepID=A0A1G7CEZ3_9FLAO|nr:TonB-dependent receptor [Ulvibacter litoralis]GHC47816.1 TonB-dependent receptor [Ulvibacter litoralis]SDE37266.1 Outer membrane receptor for ferrienterochelin and colicins [Ulvibacter litoralis]